MKLVSTDLLNEQLPSEYGQRRGHHVMFRKWAESWGPMRRTRSLALMRNDQALGFNEWAVLEVLEELVSLDEAVMKAA